MPEFKYFNKLFISNFIGKQQALFKDIPRKV